MEHPVELMYVSAGEIKSRWFKKIMQETHINLPKNSHWKTYSNLIVDNVNYLYFLYSISFIEEIF